MPTMDQTGFKFPDEINNTSNTEELKTGDEIEIEIVRLEKEGQALASSHGALHSSLLQSQPVPVTKFE